MAAIPRRNPREENQEQGVTVIAKSLAPQLGSAQAHLVEQEIDERKFAVIPNQKIQQALIYFKYRGEVDGIRFFNYMMDNFLVTSQAIGGARARQVLQAISAAAGVKSLDVAERPNLLARNLWQRSWKEKALEEGKVPVE